MPKIKNELATTAAAQTAARPSKPTQGKKPRSVRTVANPAPAKQPRRAADARSTLGKARAAVAHPAAEAPGTKQQTILSLLRRQSGATIAELTQVTGWMAHSVRGLLSAVVKRKLGLDLASTVEPERGRVYRVPGETAALAPAPLPQRRRKASRAGGQPASEAAGTAA